MTVRPISPRPSRAGRPGRLAAATEPPRARSLSVRAALPGDDLLVSLRPGAVVLTRCAPRGRVVATFTLALSELSELAALAAEVLEAPAGEAIGSVQGRAPARARDRRPGARSAS